MRGFTVLLWDKGAAGLMKFPLLKSQYLRFWCEHWHRRMPNILSGMEHTKRQAS